MFKKSTILFLTVFFLFAGCNNKKQDGGSIEMSAADSVKQANLIYTKQLVDLSGNKNIAALLCQGWELEEDLIEIRNSGESMGILPFRSFYLCPDGTVVKNPRNAIDFGHWAFDESTKTIILNYKSGDKDVYKIAALAPDELIVINSGVGSVTKLKFVSAGKRYINKTDDPYYTDNNLWRIPPEKPEPDSLIRKRLKGYIHFHILFYRDNLAKEEKVISFYGFPTCLQWYGGGIGMVKEADLTENWFKCFYNNTQAMKAYKMMNDIFGKKYKWPKERMSWVKKNLLVLEQMYDRL